MPKDFSMVGLDDYEKAAHYNPPLTTIRQPFYDIGKQAVRLSQSMMAEKSFPPKHVLIKPELIVRKSTAPPPRIESR
jgi:LacI family transcriptional regulator